MLASPVLTSYPFGLRIGLLIALIFLTVHYTRRGMQNGILLALITGMSPVAIILFRGAELLPGILPNITLDRIVWPTVLIIFFLKRRQGETERLPLDWIELSILALITVILISMIRYGSYRDEDGEWNLFKESGIYLRLCEDTVSRLWRISSLAGESGRLSNSRRFSSG
jgi:hypothetical protein